MSKLNIKRFVELMQRSKLVPTEKLRATLVACKRDHDNQFPRDPEAVAEYVVDAGLLTQWQCRHLLAGKHKGFFLGPYKLVDHIATGGMSNVYLAEHIRLLQPRAIKIFPKRRISKSSYLARFHREAQSTASLDHPHIVRTYDFNSQGDLHYMVMEYVDGQNLEAMVNESHPLGCEAVASFIAQAARGLQNAHDAGFVHRDVKPANLIVGNQGVVKVLDLGLVLITGGDPSLTLTHDENVLGTADYLAPEQAVNSHEVDPRADIYGLGCTMYFALTGHAPFTDGTVAERISKHQTSMPPKIQHDRPDCPEALASICTKMLQKSPDRRQQTCIQVTDELQNWLHDRRGPKLQALSAS